VALKVLPAAPARDPAFRKAFLDEGKVVARRSRGNLSEIPHFTRNDDSYLCSGVYISEEVNVRSHRVRLRP
ncbi:MAG: hypothetical protein L0212_09795, partial [Acidobacteria bacterium]|nr:hypothetical protein [Acidobacteriota bacterium]